MTARAIDDPPITCYRLQGCPYCERVVRLLEELGVPYRSRFVEPNHSRRDVVKRVAGVRSVPVIVDERTGVTMAESANIVDYLEATYGDREVAEEQIVTDGGSSADGESSIDDGRRDGRGPARDDRTSDRTAGGAR